MCQCGQNRHLYASIGRFSIFSSIPAASSALLRPGNFFLPVQDFSLRMRRFMVR